MEFVYQQKLGDGVWRNMEYAPILSLRSASELCEFPLGVEFKVSYFPEVSYRRMPLDALVASIIDASGTKEK